MYERYFGFKERPFRLVPDPAYLFLSRSHQEALAHLVYTVEAGDGFVALTGEVGTGKTTLCRAFLEQLDPETEVAYIFNPPGDPVDLMRAVCRDFGLAVQSGDLQDLVHSLNAFLIEKKGLGKEIVLIIDEAQNLNLHVLEQIRLLSNLETSQNKLIQIILVGQPELTRTLASNQLRQLRQRITLRCRLAALNLAETEAYIKHRIRVAASNGASFFTSGAIRRIFRFSEGIPRLINMACDRGLLAAYTEDRKTVDAGVARKAIREFQNSSGRFKPWTFWGITLAACAALLIAAVLTYGPSLSERIDSGLPRKASDSHPTQAPDAGAAGKAASREPPVEWSDPPAHADRPVATGAAVVASWLSSGDPVRTRSQSIVEAIRIWGQSDAGVRLADYLNDDLTFFQLSASQAGLEVYRIENRLDWIQRLGLPAILELVSPEDTGRGFALLTGIVEGRYALQVPDQTEPLLVDEPALRRFWSGNAYIPWKNFYAISGQIPGNAPGESLLTLKLLLRDLGYEGIDLDPEYDAATRAAVIDVQVSQDLPADGVVGSMTKIALYNTKEGLEIPRLGRQMTDDSRGAGRWEKDLGNPFSDP